MHTVNLPGPVLIHFFPQSSVILSANYHTVLMLQKCGPAPTHRKSDRLKDLGSSG